MADAAASIRITIDSTGAVSGAQKVNQSLDSITSKGRSLAASNDNVTSSLDKIGRSMSGSAESGSKLGTILDAIKGKASGAVPAVSQLASSLGEIGLLGGMIAAVAVGIAAIGAKAIEAASQVEIWKANLLTVTGNAQKAQSSYAALVQFAAKTPFDLSQSVEGFIKLRTLGLHATEQAMTSFGNTAAAMGKPLKQMIEAVADASTMEFERLKEFGIKAKQSTDTVAFTFNGATTIVKKNAADIQTYLESIGNTKFAGAMARQMDTITGAASNVGDAIFQMFAAIGGGQLGQTAKSVLQTLSAGIGAITPFLASIGNVIGAIVSAVGAVINGIVKLFAAFHGGAGGMQKGLDGLTAALNLIAEAIGIIGNAVGAVFGGIADAINGATSAVGDYLGLNQKASADTATWTDLVHAYWQTLGDGFQSAKKSLGEWLSGVGGSIKGAFSGVGDWLSQTFAGPIDYIKGLWNGFKDWFAGYFNGLDFSPAGIVVGAARIIDSVIGIFRGGFNVLVTLFSELPATIWASLSPTLQGILVGAKNVIVAVGNTVVTIFNGIVSAGSAIATSVGNVLNSILAFIEKWVNRAISAINWVIEGANRLGASFGKIGDVSLSSVAAPKPATVAGPWSTLGSDLGRAFNSGFGHEVEGFAKGIATRASKLHKAAGTGSGLDAGTAPTATQTAAGKDGKDKKGADEAAKRAKAEADFWRSLEGEVAAAKMLPLAAEDFRKELELQKILGRDLTASEKERVDTLLQEVRTAKFLTDALDAHNKAQRAVAGEEELYRKRAAGMTNDQLDVERQMLTFRNSALEHGVDLQSAGFKVAEAQARKDAERLSILKQQNAELTDAIDYAKSAYGDTTAGKRANAQTTYDRRIKNLTTAREGGALSPAEFQAGVKKAGDDFRTAIGEAADGFAGKLAGVLNQWGDAIGGKLGEVLNKFGSVFSSVGDFGKNSKSMAKSVTDLFGNADSPLTKSIGKAVGGAFAGLQIGESVASLAKVVGMNSSAQTGAKIGGAIGGLTGNPLIALGASVVGGLIGSLFYKAPRGKSIITSGTDSQITGNKAEVRDQLTGTTGSIQNSLQSIAQQLGGKIGSFMVSIGKYKDYFRVSSTGANNVDIKKAKYISGLIYDGKDEATAIRLAIKDAIQDGAVTGISELMDKALKTLAGNLDKALSTAVTIKSFEDDYKAIFDPLGAAVESVTKPLSDLRDTFLEIGATTADLTKLDEYRAKKLQQVLKDQTKGFQEILDQLNGDAGGVTALSQLTTELTQLAGFKADIASGKTVDQDTYTALADKILTNAGNAYGTNTTDYQNIVSSLRDTTSGAIANVSSLVNASSTTSSTATTDTSTAAINAQTDAITAQQGITNDLLRQILDRQAGSTGGHDYLTSGSYNGRLTNAL